MNEAEIATDADKLFRAIQAFQEANIRMVLIGGMAMLSYGANNNTKDIDLAYALSRTRVNYTPSRTLPSA